MNVIVVMNADGSSAVNVDIQLGFKVPILSSSPYLLIPIGIVLFVLGLLLLREEKDNNFPLFFLVFSEETQNTKLFSLNRPVNNSLISFL